MWSCINNVIGRAKPHKPVINDKTLLMNFQNVAVSPDHCSANCFLYPNAFSFHEISPSTVSSHLSKLDVTKAMGPDGLSATFLKPIADVIVVTLV